MNDEDAFRSALLTITPPMPEPRVGALGIERLARRRRSRRRAALVSCSVAGALMVGGIGYGIAAGGANPTGVASSPGQRPTLPGGSAGGTAGVSAPSGRYLTKHMLAEISLVLKPARPLVCNGSIEMCPSFVSRQSILAKRDWTRGQYPGARPVRVVLRYATDNAYGRELPGGGMHRFIDDRLVWVVIVPDLRVCPIGGPMPKPGSTPPPYRCYRGFFLDMFDAHTGRYLRAMSF
jgi:hypothetical protein